MCVSVRGKWHFHVIKTFHGDVFFFTLLKLELFKLKKCSTHLICCFDTANVKQILLGSEEKWTRRLTD